MQMHTPFMDTRSPHGHARRGISAGGRLRQRLAHILTRSSCTTNTASAAATGGCSATAFVSLAKTTADDSSHNRHQEEEAPPSPYFCTPCTYERPKVDGGPRRRRRSRSASLVHISVDCTGGAASGRRSVHSDAPLLRPQQHRSAPARDAVRRRQSKGGGWATGKPAARSPSASRRHRPCSSSSASSWGRARRPSRSATAAPYNWSSSASASSTATDDELAPSSGEEEEADTGTLFSSLSLSSDSTSEFYHTTNGNGGGRGRSTNTRRVHSHSHRNTARRHAPRRAQPRASDPASPPDAFRPLVSVEASKRAECGERKKGVGNAKKPVDAAAEKEEKGETGAGMAVVKRSSNPYLDFRSSMVEMVVERRIGSVGQMEELLGSYLSLNSPRHHPAILAAFEDVWEAVFGEE
ncbi:hypothetical protein BS78_03G201300 [Paspalum vaginatum]|nr:hypothetical protein BS78_03G201300 [Paspalum vaginatum]